jgi:hypothetical protein
MRVASLAAALLTLTVVTTPSAHASPPRTSGLTGALYAAGGGAGPSFSTIRALNSMLGEAAVQAEMQHLQEEYGDTGPFISLFDYAMTDAWIRAGKANVSITTQHDLSGQQLANELISAGTKQHSFTVQRLFGALFPPQVAAEVLIDVDVKYGADASTSFQKLTNSFFTDTGQQLGVAALKGPGKTR